MNTVIQVVTLGGDPELKTYGEDGKSRVTFSGAVPKRYTKNNEDKTNWFNYVAFGSTADFIAKYFTKGSKMLIVGEINNNNYEKDGVKHYGNQILIQNAEFYGKKSDGTQTSESVSQATPAATPAPAEPTSAPLPPEPAISSYDAYDDF